MKGIFSFIQYCSNAVSEFGPIAMISTPRLVNFSYSLRKRANCARQYGHIKPRRKASTTGLLPRKSESRISLPFISSNSKSGASSPGVISLFISTILSPSSKYRQTFSRSISRSMYSVGWDDMNKVSSDPPSGTSQSTVHRLRHAQTSIANCE